MTVDDAGATANSVPGEAGWVLQARDIREVHLHSADASAESLSRRPIGDWHPYALQVHKALSVPSPDVPLPLLPAYVRRNHDDALDDELRDLTANYMIVLVGGSSTGKTRAFYEAINRHPVLHHWGLVHPRTGEELYSLLTGDRLEPYTILWLNEIHNYISGPSGQTVAAELHAQLTNQGAVRPFIVVATLWPEFWATLTSEPVSVHDPHLRARSLLEGAVRIDVAERFSDDSIARLLDEPATDPRLRLAARTAGPRGAVIQTLVGGPSLVRRFESPDTVVDRYAAAVVSVALDARQLGHRAPFPRALLATASGAYLSEEDRVGAPADWFEQGLRRASRDRTHGISLLLPVRAADDQPGEADSYDIHDYLEQHGWQSRRFRSISAALWAALLEHTRSADDMAAIGASAFNRLSYRYAEAFLLASVKHGYDQAKWTLVDLLDAQERLEEEVHVLLGLAARDAQAHRRLIDLLVAHHAIDDVRVFVDIGDYYAVEKLADLLVELGEVDDLTALLEQSREGIVRLKLAQLLERQDRVDEALSVLAQGDAAAHLLMVAIMARHGLVQALEHFEHVDTRCLLGDLCARHAQAQLIDLLARRGEAGRARSFASQGAVADQRYQALLLWQHDYPEHAEAVLQPLSDAGDVLSTRYRIDLLPRPAQPSASTQVMESYNPPADRDRLANFLAEHEMVDELRELADSHEYGKWRLLNLLAEQGDTEELAELADTGHVNACRRLAEILARQGRVAELRTRVARGDVAARDELVWLSAAKKRKGSGEAAELLRRGLELDGTLGRSSW